MDEKAYRVIADHFDNKQKEIDAANKKEAVLYNVQVKGLKFTKITSYVAIALALLSIAYSHNANHSHKLQSFSKAKSSQKTSSFSNIRFSNRHRLLRKLL